MVTVAAARPALPAIAKPNIVSGSALRRWAIIPLLSERVKTVFPSKPFGRNEKRSQQKSPEPEGSVSVNEEGKFDLIVLRLNNFLYK
ncbi:hypothetical protein GOODEAATRI_030824 [Goodea atripinnis]|uniref:Uncharacterized protein n=1 Tax=Goodea atripinnis TaxID=208336 RepID=A0ABV0P939_9TELE